MHFSLDLSVVQDSCTALKIYILHGRVFVMGNVDSEPVIPIHSRCGCQCNVHLYEPDIDLVRSVAKSCQCTVIMMKALMILHSSEHFGAMLINNLNVIIFLMSRHMRKQTICIAENKDAD